jgi:hypothetical protein
MKTTDDAVDLDELVREIERYLEVVAEFRAEGCDVGGLNTRTEGERDAR